MASNISNQVQQEMYHILGSKEQLYYKELNDKITSLITYWKTKKVEQLTLFVFNQIPNEPPQETKYIISRKIEDIGQYVKNRQLDLGAEHPSKSFKNIDKIKFLLEQAVKGSVFLPECENNLCEVIKILCYIDQNQRIPSNNTHNESFRIFMRNVIDLAKIYFPIIPAETISRGLCFGMVTSFARAIFSRDLYTLVYRLKLLSTREPWIFIGNKYNSLSDAIEGAYKFYKRYKQAFFKPTSRPEHIYESFRLACPDGYFLIELRAWIENLLLSNMPHLTPISDFLPKQSMIKQFNFLASNTMLSREIHKNENKELLYATHDWPVPLQKKHLRHFLSILVSGFYTLCTGEHIFAIKIENEQLFIFDQNYREFILAINKNEIPKHQDNIYAMFCAKPNINIVIFKIQAISASQEKTEILDNSLRELTFCFRKIFDRQTNLEDCQVIKLTNHTQLQYAVFSCNLLALKDLLSYKSHKSELKKKDGLYAKTAAMHGYAKLTQELLDAGDISTCYDPANNNCHEIVAIGKTYIEIKINGIRRHIPISLKNIYY